MNKMDNATRLMDLMPQPALLVDVQNDQVIFSNKAANACFSFDCHMNMPTPTIEQLIRHTSSMDALRAAACKMLQIEDTCILHNVCLKTATHEAVRFDIHITYVDETHKSVYLIFAQSAHERERIEQQSIYYAALSDASYSYPFHLDVKARRIEFFNQAVEIDYHLPPILENFPESIFDYNYICEDDKKDYLAAIDRMYKGEPPQGSFRFYDVNGALVRYSLKYVVNRDQNGQPIEVNGDFIVQSTAQGALEYQANLQKTVHECIDILFTVGTTSQSPNVAYTAVLNQIKDYYDAEGVYFYKFASNSHTVNKIYTVFDDHLKALEPTLPIVANENERKWMALLTKAQSSNVHKKLDLLPQASSNAMRKQLEQYHIKRFSCVEIKSVSHSVMGFVGILNAQKHVDNKQLLELLSRPICMFIEFQHEQRMKQELLKLEANSKANVVKECVENFRAFSHHKEHISAVLQSLCAHYNADVAVILTSDKENNGDYTISHIGGSAIPNFDDLQPQPATAMKKWTKIFQQHKHFITDTDLDNSAAKALLKAKFGIFNFIAAPIQDERGVLTGLLYVMNYKTLDRSNLLTHIVANNIAAYLDKIALYEAKHVEPLTKLTDKIATENQITEYLEDGTKGSLFIIDIDHFKTLNDTFGHQLGDKAIVMLANAIKQSFRQTDVIGRIGGDEFMVFCPSLTAEDLINQIAQYLLEKCNLLFEKDGVTMEVTASIGICLVDERYSTFQSLYEKADEVLYIAKHNGKNQYQIYGQAVPADSNHASTEKERNDEVH